MQNYENTEDNIILYIRRYIAENNLNKEDLSKKIQELLKKMNVKNYDRNINRIS